MAEPGGDGLGGGLERGAVNGLLTRVVQANVHCQFVAADTKRAMERSDAVPPSDAHQPIHPKGLQKQCKEQSLEGKSDPEPKPTPPSQGERRMRVFSSQLR